MSDYNRYEREHTMQTKYYISKVYSTSYIKMDIETGSEQTSKHILNVGEK